MATVIELGFRLRSRQSFPYPVNDNLAKRPKLTRGGSAIPIEEPLLQRGALQRGTLGHHLLEGVQERFAIVHKKGEVQVQDGTKVAVKRRVIGGNSTVPAEAH